MNATLDKGGEEAKKPKGGNALKLQRSSTLVEGQNGKKDAQQDALDAKNAKPRSKAHSNTFHLASSVDSKRNQSRKRSQNNPRLKTSESSATLRSKVAALDPNLNKDQRALITE